MISDKKCSFFPFWRPVVFEPSENPGKTKIEKAAWAFGSFVDQYLYLGKQISDVKAEKIDAKKIYFEKKQDKQISFLNTALKICSYILSFSVLPVFALPIKWIFKNALRERMALTKKSPHPIIAEKWIGKTKIVLVKGSLTKETTHAIVNPANATLLPLAGVCGIIKTEAGQGVFDECQEILKKQKRNKLSCGESVVTSSGNLSPAIKVIVHAVGPNCSIAIENKKRKELLAKAYKTSLKHLTYPHNRFNPKKYWISSKVSDTFHSITFPSISTGIFKFPIDEAAPIALKTIKEFIENNPGRLEEVRFAFIDDSFKPYQKALEAL